ncbi:MAG: hypothetical protein K2H29_03480 [Oscillospiraceae bacterium]|nr:hypothetical protein [Oscillospiraceae bacterium]
MDKSRYIEYTENDRNIVKSGIKAIKKELLGDNMDRKRSLLFCLDWFMDPYYRQDISAFKTELIDLLQTMIISKNDIDVKEDALELLRFYTWGSYEILEKNIDKIENTLRSDVIEMINENK